MFVSVTQMEKHKMEDPGIKGCITFNKIFKKQDGEYGLDLSGSGQGHEAGNNKHGEYLGLIKCAQFVN